MQKMFKKPHSIMLYKERNEFQEFKLAKSGLSLCRLCGAIYYKKSWHHPNRLSELKINHTKIIDVSMCPACKMISGHAYEGEVLIENIPWRFKPELNNLVLSFLGRAYKEDCQHRLIALKKLSQTTWQLLLTENQLASRVAKKISEVFGGLEIKISFSREPFDVERAVVKFPVIAGLLTASTA